MKKLQSLGKIAALSVATVFALIQPAKAVAPMWESNFGSALGLSDDDVSNQTFDTFNFPFVGTNYTGSDTLSISSNGFISLGGDNGNDCCSGDPSELVNDSFARVAPLWTDINPRSAGDVFFNTFNDDADVSIDRVVVTWDSVLFGNSEPFIAQAQLFENGNIIFGYDDFNLSRFNNTLIGISPANGVSDPGSIDLTANIPFDSGTEPTIYELFIRSSPAIDVANNNIVFSPNGSDGFAVSSSASVPFEFSPTLGLFLMGGLFGVSRYAKSRKVSKLIDK